MTNWAPMFELAHILELEWRGQPIDRHRARTLATMLLPEHPQIRSVLTSVQDRMATERRG